jgi:hypothetical protein
MYVVDSNGEIVLHRNLTAAPDAFLSAIAPFCEDLVLHPDVGA